MHAIKHLLTRYTLFMWATEAAGRWGVFAGLRSTAALGDFRLISWSADSWQRTTRWILYVTMASAGSALGSLVVYAIGYAGGEELLRKRVSLAFRKLQPPSRSILSEPDVPLMLPPPTPFKAFALAAAVAEMSIKHFLLAILPPHDSLFSAGYSGDRGSDRNRAWSRHSSVTTFIDIDRGSDCAGRGCSRFRASAQ
jgi:hypothetical protein